jgi:hypothetical protein
MTDVIQPQKLKDAALLDPASIFAGPEAALSAPGLTETEKAAILRSWKYDAAELAVAEEEGMPGDGGDLLRRVPLALGQLRNDIDVDRVGPTKQHGLLA